MRISPKLSSYLLAGILMSLAWSLRGQFGHLKGAMIPGAFAGLWILLRSRTSVRENSGRLFLIPALGALGFALGGHMSYGKLFEQIMEARRFSEILLPAVQIFWTGFLWGGLGMSLLGMACQEKPLSRCDFSLLIFLISIWSLFLGIFNLESWDRSIFAFSFVLIHITNLFFKKSKNISIFGAYGALGWSLGFLISGLLLTLGDSGLFGACPFWQMRDQVIGFIGGLTLEKACSKNQKGSDPFGVRPQQVLGLIALFFWLAIPNAFNVSYYWQESGNVSKIVWIITAMASMGYFISIPMIFREIASDAARPRNDVPKGTAANAVIASLLRRSEASASQRREADEAISALGLATLFLIFYLSFLAIAKQIAVYGWNRWEPGFTLIVILDFILVFAANLRGLTQKAHFGSDPN